MKPGLQHRPRKIFFILSPVLLVIAGVSTWVGVSGLHFGQAAEPVITQVSPSAIEQSETPAAEVEPTEAAPVPSTTPSQTAVSYAAISVPSSGSLVDQLNAEGVMVLAMRDGAFIHLFAYHPVFLPLTRLTNTPWDDMSPALSPDGTRLAFASRMNGYWDLYLLDLESGMRTRLTDTPEIETSPTWAPDGQWIAYQRFDGASLDIEVLPIADPAGGVIRLTDSPGLDSDPAWSPQGRQIAFVSDRSGDEEIWIADLDKVEGRFTNISQSAISQDRYPVWSRDGSRLAWSSEKGGARRLVVWQEGKPAVQLPSEGSHVAWSPGGDLLFTELRGPNQVSLTAYHAAGGRIALQPLPLPGALYGMTWVPGPLPAKLVEAIQKGDQTPPPALYRVELDKFPISPAGRKSLVELDDVTAPQALLHDEVDEAFQDLRLELGIEAGWDALSSLENTFVAVTTPNDPANEDEWLYTGRAFALNPLLMSAGWMVVTREDFGGQAYWRVYLRARYQDGSMGMPVAEQVFDLNARYSGSTRSYEQGGRFVPPPSGYWVDLTELAARYGWERLPSQTSWRTYYPSIRFNQFAITGGLDWYAAMSQIYPPEALLTATPRPTYTPLATVTALTPQPTVAPTKAPTPSPVVTRRPTWTPLPNFAP